MEQPRSESLRRGRWRSAFIFFTVLTGLSVLTTWNLTQSAALRAARRAYSQGDLPRSLKHALDHLQRQPWSREASLLAANCLSRLDYADEAEPFFSRAGQLSLADSQVRAYGLARGPHPERAIAAYQQILQGSPDNVTALRRLAGVLLARNDTEELLKLAERLSVIPGGAVIGQTLRGVVHHNDKNPQQAVIAFQRVLELDPDLRQMPLPPRLFWSHLVDDLVLCGQADEAGRQLTRVLSRSRDAELMNRLGRIRFLQGALDDAQRCFDEALQWDPGNSTTHLNLAKLALQRQERDQALEHLSQARILAPRQYEVLYNLASLYRQLGRPIDADRIQAVIKQLRIDTTSSRRLPSAPWPSYAL
jgi:tetratricopeptide (TPR) repeat protein